MPVSGGQHPRPPLDAGVTNISPKFRRSDKGLNPDLPQPDYNGKESKTVKDTPRVDQTDLPAETADTGTFKSIYEEKKIKIIAKLRVSLLGVFK